MQLNWRDALVQAGTAIHDTLKVLDETGIRLVMVVDEYDHLLGVVSDGDIRRALLNRVDFGGKVTEIMNPKPHVARIGERRDVLRSLMERFSLIHIPLVDNDNRVVGLETFQQLLRPVVRDNWVCLMAGGFGTRLGPLTENCPKPMLPVGGKPILETILESFIAAGFRQFFISVHYLPMQIKSYFGDGSRWGITIRYIEESVPLGTGGALGLLPQIDELPVIVMNGDVLTQLDFNALLDFHVAQEALMTLCVREYEIQVPFGVVEGVDTTVTEIVEKPVQKFFVNAGVYVISPEVLKRTYPPRRMDMPDLVKDMLALESKISMFPVHEYWLDIGRPDDYARALRAGRDPGLGF